jgi:CelD/BcsL family acetyltransferase involved in cellulose biosynthesis
MPAAMSEALAARPTGDIRLEIVTTGERLAAVAAAWNALWRSLDGLIFQDHAWVSAWWRTLPPGDMSMLRIGLAWKGDVLLAVMPLCVRRRKGLRFLEWAASPFTDYPDVLAAPLCPRAPLEALWGEITRAGGFDLAFLSRLSPDAAARRLVSMQRPEGVRLRANYRREVSHRVVGPWTNGTEWFESQSKKTRKNYRHSLNMIDKAGGARFRLLPADAPLGPVLDRLWALKRKWLVERERESDMFHRDNAALVALTDVLAQAGILRIFVLECDGAIIALSVNFVQHGTMMAFLTTYDPEFGRASPGMLLMMDYIRWSFDNGLGMVDFLCGAEPFKQRFATQSVDLDTFTGIRTPRGALATIIDHGRKRLLAFRERRQPGLAAGALPVEGAE